MSLDDALSHLEAGREALAAGDPARAEHEAAEALGRDPGCVEAGQLMALAYIQQNDPERAGALLDRRDEFPKTAAFAGWADIAEHLTRWDDARAIYDEHLSRHPRDATAHYRLGLVALAQGARDRARAAFLSATRLDPAATLPAAELARLYEEDGLLGAAAELYDRALAGAPGDPELAAARDLVVARLRELQALPEVCVEPAKEAARALLQWFSGREGVYARQWADAEGRTGYAPVHEPLTERVLVAHVHGELTAGVYVARTDDTVHFLAFDIDITKQALSRADDPETRQRLDALVRADVRTIASLLDRLDLPWTLEASGYKGCHIWICFAAPVPARQARAFAQAVIRQAGPPPESLHREIFPKQDRVPDGQLGNLIKLPLGVHRKTGRRALFVDTAGRAYADQVAVLNTIKTAAPEDFERAIARLVGAPAASGENGQTRAPAAGTLPTLEALRERFPGLAPVWERCTVMRDLIRKAQTEHHLTHAERVVLACVFAHLGDEGVALLHAVIANCLDYAEETTRYHIERTRANPISCPRIRQHIPEITARAACPCAFDLPEDGYPSPVLFADPRATAGRARPRPEHAEIDALIRKYVELTERWRGVQRERDAAEGALRDRLETAEGGALLTDVWRVTRHPESGELRVELRSSR